MPFIEPVLALCSDRTRRAPENPRLAGPDLWLPRILRETGHLCAVSFDYFINWQNRQLDRELWLKCPLDVAKVPDWKHLGEKDVRALLRRHTRFTDLVRFARYNQASAAAILFDDAQDWSAEDATLLVARWPKDADTGQGLALSRLARPELEARIRQKSGGPVRIGHKGLIYSTSRLECFLSRTDALWPGDADLLICEKASMRPLALIEYKKHTGRSSIPFAEQRLANYYPKPDGRKYDRLAILAEQLVPGRIPFFTLYYSTLADVPEVKLEEIAGMSGNLREGQSQVFNISPDDPRTGYSAIINTLHTPGVS